MDRSTTVGVDPADRRRDKGPAARFAAAIVLAVALGYAEAAVVVALRAAIAPLREIHHPGAVKEVVPLLTLGQLEQGGQRFLHLLSTEVGRELSPIVVLLAMAWGLARTRRQFGGLFLLGFGVWDIFYYAWLKVLLDCPASPGTWDVLYLIPTAWVAPVWAPMLVAATMAAAGAVLVFQTRPGVRGRRAVPGWLAVAAGVALVLTSFFLRTKEAFHRVPAQFDWPCFLPGWALMAAGLAWLLWAAPSGAKQGGREHRAPRLDSRS